MSDRPDHDLADRLSIEHQHPSPSGKIGLCQCPRCPDLRAAAAQLRQLTDKNAENEKVIEWARQLTDKNAENEKVIEWADDALKRRDRTIADLLAERDAAVARADELERRIEQARRATAGPDQSHDEEMTDG